MIYKLLFAGPVGAGKTAAIRALSDIPVVQTEESASDEVRKLKQTTTVALDYGVMNLPNGDQLRLFGTPGQKRFDFMWDILAEGALGLVLLIDASSREPVAELRDYVSHFHKLIARSALAVGVTHVDRGGWAVRKALADELQRMQIAASVVDVDARSRDDVALLAKSLLFTLDPLAATDDDAITT